MKTLLIGYGNIAKIHAKYLEAGGKQWDWYDPHVDGGIDYPDNLDCYDSIFILTPERTHYDIHQQLRNSGYEQRIFVEKPAALRWEDFGIFKDSNIFVGLVERYNPAVQTLLKHCDSEKIINVDFSRCCVAEHSSEASLVEDLGIHDLDLFLQITKLAGLEHQKYRAAVSDVKAQLVGNTCVATITGPVIGRFIWSKDTYFKERRIVVRQNDCTFEVDLQEQTVVKHYYHEGKIVSESLYVEKSSPIANEQNAFFCGDAQEDIEQSHDLLLRLIDIEQTVKNNKK